MPNVIKLEEEIKDLLNEFKQDINRLNENLQNEFHKKLISLLAKYPDKKELIEFITYINDRLEDSFDKKMDIMIDYIIKIIKLKKEHLYITKEIKEKIDKTPKKILNPLITLFTNKIFISILAIIVIIIIYFIDKEFAKTLITNIKLF